MPHPESWSGNGHRKPPSNLPGGEKRQWYCACSCLVGGTEGGKPNITFNYVIKHI